MAETMAGKKAGTKVGTMAGTTARIRIAKCLGAFVVLAMMLVPWQARSQNAAENMASGPAPHEADFVIHNFHFQSGETMPEVRLHYTTLGTPVKDARGRTTNAVLILHGTSGSGKTFLHPIFAGVLFWARATAGRDEVLHYSSGQRRPRKIEQAERRHACALSAI